MHEAKNIYLWYLKLEKEITIMFNSEIEKSYGSKLYEQAEISVLHVVHQ